MNPDYINGLIGGALVGLSATIMFLALGRVAGISGIIFGTLKPSKGDTSWRINFLFGLVFGGLVALSFNPALFTNESNRTLPYIIVAGLLVGFGTRLGSGCTSGHGVCGISRLSIRSILATVTFILAGIVTVWVLNIFA